MIDFANYFLKPIAKNMCANNYTCKELQKSICELPRLKLKPKVLWHFKVDSVLKINETCYK